MSVTSTGHWTCNVCGQKRNQIDHNELCKTCKRPLGHIPESTTETVFATEEERLLFAKTLQLNLKHYEDNLQAYKNSIEEKKK